jgi:hypothetical protein
MLVSVMWSIWGAIVVILAGLFIYRSSLTKDEDDQIYLDPAFDHEKAAQAAIVSKVAKIEPMVKVTTWLAAVSTVFVICYYIVDIARTLGYFSK